MSIARLALDAIMIGAGATAIGDLWALILRRAFAVPSLDWALVGRWIGHMPRGRFAHSPIAAAAPIRNERILGWIAHYGIGIAFAAILLTIWGTGWAEQPTPGPALIVGLASIAAPFLIMQPAFGAGVAASNLPNPATARLKSLITHLVFGLGLYLAALLRAALT
jgi:hypothetical protein